MKLPISDRLLACAAFVCPGDRIADVGCDHGYLSIHLLQENIAASAICSDVRQQPLQSAVRNAEKYGLREKMEFYLSDGVQNIPRDFNTLICAGMGADTMVSIFTAAPWLKDSQYRLILQCQSKNGSLRRYLTENGWKILQEQVVKDGKFLYPVTEIIWQPGEELTPGQCYFPPTLVKNEHYEAYYEWVVKGLENIVLNRKEQADPFMAQALEELRKKEW